MALSTHTHAAITPDGREPTIPCLPLSLGYATLDTLHSEMAILLEAAITAPDSGLADALTRLQHHCEHHFAVEETLMSERRFAGYHEHRHEHRQLLAEVNSMSRAVARGRLRLVRAWLSERLPEWFRLHVATLDGLLVSYLQQG